MDKQKKNSVIITDVTLREYGQNVPLNYLHIFTPAIRIKIALSLINAGFTNIEILSCVHPGVAPAMNREQLKNIAAGLGRVDGINFITLVPNKAGYNNFLSNNPGPEGFNHTMGIFFSAIEAHNLANLGRTLKETVDEYRVIVRDALDKRIRVSAYISASFGYIEPETGVLIRANIDNINHYSDLFFDLGG